MQVKAKILRIDAAAGWMEVLPAASNCGNCSRSAACGMRTSGDGEPGKPTRVGILSDARPGQNVVLTVPDGQILKAASVVYLLPLVLGLLCAMLADYFVAPLLVADINSAWAAALAPIGLVLGIAIGLLNLRRISRSGAISAVQACSAGGASDR